MSDQIGPNWAFKTMSLIHDNPLRRKFASPEKILKKAGLGEKMTVLEVGCGPGFYTIPAARILHDGKLYANDIHPLAIKRVQEKLREHKISNVDLLQSSVTNTGLNEETVDLAFLFGVPRMLKNEKFFYKVVIELKRILKPKGIISIKTRKNNLKNIMERYHFGFLEENNGIQKFIKE